MNRHVTIYALCEPDTDEVRYVGKTVSPNTRLAEHLYNETGKRNPKTVWVQSVRKRGLRPSMITLEVVAEPDALIAERKWINHHLGIGAKLTNLK